MAHAIILAGGSGERFWPLSRSNRPKQFLPLGDQRTLLRATFERVAPLVGEERVWVVTHARHARRVRRELPELVRGRVLSEPEARNTAAAVHLAALAVGRSDPGAAMVVVPADAWVPRATPYRSALRTALARARAHDDLVLVGVAPDRPETGYGYIELGPAHTAGPGFRVARFQEKPDASRAARFAASGRHLWNCGIFAWREDVLSEAVREHLPQLHRALEPLRTGRWTADRLRRAYRRAPRISVDYGLIEPASNLAVIPGEFAWDDLGSWPALARLGDTDGFRRGQVVALDSPNHVVWADEGVAAVIGVPDVVVVHTRDATLVVAKERAQEVRAVVARLRRTPEGRRLLEG